MLSLRNRICRLQKRVPSLFSRIAIWITETRSHGVRASASALTLLADVLGVGPLGPCRLGPLLHGFFGGERNWISRGAADTFVGQKQGEMPMQGGVARVWELLSEALQYLVQSTTMFGLDEMSNKDHQKINLEFINNI